MTSAAEVLTYLPRLAFHGMFGNAKAEPSDLHATLRKTAPALGTAAGFETFRLRH